MKPNDEKKDAEGKTKADRAIGSSYTPRPDSDEKDMQKVPYEKKPTDVGSSDKSKKMAS